MKNHASNSASRSGFTLVELLTVIGIIAVLMTLLFPAVNAVKENAKRMDAKNTCVQIVTAVKQYYQEYGKFPPVEDLSGGGTPTFGPTVDTIVGDTGAGMAAKLANNTLFHTLRALNKAPNDKNSQFNPRKVGFFEAKAAIVNDTSKRGGFYDRTSNGGAPAPAEDGCLYDPWGHQYGVIMDTNYDNRIDLTVSFYTDFAGVTGTTGLAPRQTVGAFSMGKDGKLGTNGNKMYKNGTDNSDDVISWQ